jgi:hypothetical protein
VIASRGAFEKHATETKQLANNETQHDAFGRVPRGEIEMHHSLASATLHFPAAIPGVDCGEQRVEEQLLSVSRLSAVSQMWLPN